MDNKQHINVGFLITVEWLSPGLLTLLVILNMFWNYSHPETVKGTTITVIVLMLVTYIICEFIFQCESNSVADHDNHALEKETREYLAKVSVISRQFKQPEITRENIHNFPQWHVPFLLILLWHQGKSFLTSRYASVVYRIAYLGIMIAVVIGFNTLIKPDSDPQTTTRPVSTVTNVTITNSFNTVTQPIVLHHHINHEKHCK